MESASEEEGSSCKSEPASKKPRPQSIKKTPKEERANRYRIAGYFRGFAKAQPILENKDSISIREITFREQELNWLFAKYKRLENNLISSCCACCMHGNTYFSVYISIGHTMCTVILLI